MKRIIYKDSIEFNLPEHWVVEKDGNVGVFYEQGCGINTLRVELLVAKSPKPVDKNTASEMLKALSKGDGEINDLGDGSACRCYLAQGIELEQQMTIHYWYVANAVSPNIGRLATFSFSTLSRNKIEPETLQILRMLDREIKSCKFIN